MGFLISVLILIVSFMAVMFFFYLKNRGNSELSINRDFKKVSEEDIDRRIATLLSQLSEYPEGKVGLDAIISSKAKGGSYEELVSIDIRLSALENIFARKDCVSQC